MKRILLSIIFFISCSVTLYAQNTYTVKGYVIDTAYTAKLVNSSVSVLNAKDSTLVKFGRVGSNGAFSIEPLKKGNFILLVTYPGYADYTERFSLDSAQKAKDFGKINLMLKANLLSAVEIKGKVNAVRMNGDTTEFNADSYIIQPNSKVEALLKQLPGVQVDRDGKITAQGKKVDKVLVDGEEFFGDDPTLVTKNIRGDMVDKVQLYDRKSEQAAFTGIDDGQRAKTINIKLKEGKKSGAFGKLNAGLGTNKMYEGQATYNRFQGKKKFGFYGNIANTGGQMGMTSFDLSSMDDIDFSAMGGGGGMVVMAGGMGEDLSGFDGGYGGQGIPLSRAGGLHFNNKWNDGKESVNANYKVNSMDVDGTRNTQTQNNYPNGITKSNSDETFSNSSFGQKADGKYAIKLDSLSDLKVSFGGSLKHSKTVNDFKENTLRENDLLLNESERHLNNTTDGKAFRASVFWAKKFMKKGRTFSLNVSENMNRNDAKGFLNSENSFYNEKGKLDSTKVIDQYKTNRSNSSVFNSNLTYSEPISDNFAAVLNYGVNVNNSTQDRRSFNKDGAGKYNVLDSTFSNNYRLDQLTNTGGLAFSYKGEKSFLNFGTKIVAVRFEQKNVFTDERIKRNFVNWSPQLNYQYRMSPQNSLSFNYNGQTSQPGIDQIQPVRVNTDPLNITIGNPNLKPSFNSNFNLNYSSFKLLSSNVLMFGGSYSFTMNPIMTNTVRDTTTGKSTYQAINLTEKNNSNYGINVNYGTAFKALDMHANIGLSANGSTNYSFLNSSLNQTKSYSFSANLNLSQGEEGKYNVNVDFSPNYNISQSSLQKQYNDNGWGFNSRPAVTVFLPWKIEIGTDGQYEFRAKTKSFNEDYKRFIWNASISRKFLKDQSLYLTISAKDILNQNNGFSRSASENSIVQTNYTMLKRYVICSLSWDFNKMGGA